MAKSDLIVVCKNCSQEIHYLREPEKNMGYIECPKCKSLIDQDGTVFSKPQVTIDVQKEIDKLLDEHKQLHISFALEDFDNYYEFKNYYDKHEGLIQKLESRNVYHVSRNDFLDDYRKFEKQELKLDNIDINEITQYFKSFKLKESFIYIAKNNSIIINATKDEFNRAPFLSVAMYKALRLIPRKYWGAFKFLPQELESEDRIITQSMYELDCLRVNSLIKNFQSAYSENNSFIKSTAKLKGDFLKQAQTSFRDNNIKLNRFFADLQQEHYAVDEINLISADFVEKDFPVYVGKYIDGLRCQIHKDGTDVSIYSNEGSDLSLKFNKICDAIRELSADGIVLLATVENDDSIDDIICHINDVLYCDADIHKLNFSDRKDILDSLGIEKSSFDKSVNDYILNKTPYILCKKREELENAIKRISNIENYCGIVICTDVYYSLQYQQPGIFIYDVKSDKKQYLFKGRKEIDEAWLLCDFLNCEIKDIFISTIKIPTVEAGNIFNAIEEKTKKFTLIETRNFGSYEIPPIYNEIRLKKNLSKTFLIEGTRFYYEDIKNMPLIINCYPVWGGFIIRYIGHIDNREFISGLGKQINIYAHENNFLRNEKFSVAGEFLDDQTITWDDLKLTASVKNKLKKLESLIVKNDPSIDSRGLIFIGPPGCGKTLTGKLLSKMAPTFIWVTAKDCSEMGAAYAFSTAFNLARNLRPTILFMEDIDSHIEYGMVDLLKTELDGMKLNNGVFTILTSNFPEKLPEALIDRPGRFHDIIYFTLPNKDIRKEMLLHFLKEEIDSETMESVLKQTDGFSGAHMKEVCRFAQLLQNEDHLDLPQAVLKSLRKLLEQRKLIQDLKNKNKNQI